MSAPVELLPPAEATSNNPLWHKLRREGVTASEIAAVLGLSPWDSPFSLYWQKINGWSTPDNPEMAAGRRAEPLIADWFAEGSGPNVAFWLDRAGLFASTERPWQMATPDRLIRSRPSTDRVWSMDIDQDMPTIGLLECKYLIGGWDGWGEPGTDDIPVHYRAQALWQLDVLDVAEVYVAAWHGADLRVYRIRRDERDLRIMRAAAEQFLHRVAVGDIPDVDSHTATLRTLRALHPSLDDRDQQISPVTADGYRRARVLKARAAAHADLWEARLRAEMGDARRAVCGDVFIASRSIYQRAGYTVGAADIDKLNPARSKKP